MGRQVWLGCVEDWTLRWREACGSPKRARKRDGLDVEAAGGMAEVQKEQESVTDWTLKLREACGSPKGARKRGGLDVEAAGSMWKSKRSKKA